MTSAPTSGTSTEAVVGFTSGAAKAGSEGGPEYTVIVATRGAEPEREFLMVRHRDRGWELPGGKLEGKEGPVHCALREFREETGHLLGEPKFVLKQQKSNGLCFVFTGRLGPEVEARGSGEVVQEMRWFQALPDELAFPDDPYDEIGTALGLDFKTGTN